MLSIKTYIYHFLYAGEKLLRSFHASVTDDCTTTAVTSCSLSWPDPFFAGHLSIRDYKCPSIRKKRLLHINFTHI